MAAMKYCPCCEVEREFRPENRSETYDVRGLKVQVPVAVEVCASCGETLLDEARDQALLIEAYAEYRRSKNLLFPHEIKETRERYALSQKSFAALLGMSEATINRYEQGGLQEETHDNAIRLAAAPEALRSLLERRGHLLSEWQRQRAGQAVQRALPDAPSTPRSPPVIDPSRLGAFCRRWRIAELALFGSVLRDDFAPGSDVDALVRFGPDARWQFEDLDAMRRELEAQFGRPVDLVDRAVLEHSRNYLRRRAILDSARVIYAA